MRLYTISVKDEDNDVNQRVCFVKAYGREEALDKAEHESLIRWFRGKNKNTKFMIKEEILHDYTEESHTVFGKEETN